MPALMTPAQAHQAAATVGWATTLMGGALLLAPRRAAFLLQLPDPRGARVVGLLDLALVPGLVAGCPRWPWMAGRALLNLGIAGYVLRTAPPGAATTKARIGALALGALTVADTTVALALLPQAWRRPGWS